MKNNITDGQVFEFCIGGKATTLHDFVKASFDSFRNMYFVVDTTM